MSRAQLSPGPLATAHASLDKQTQCFQCHARGGKSAMDQRCLACHTEIASRIAHGRGFHAREGSSACATCHPDHAGRNFSLIQWDGGDPKKFDHKRTGFALTGAHAKVACATCHAPRFQDQALPAADRPKDAAHSWLGLNTACASCHKDPHAGQLGDRCVSCHNDAAWKPAGGFDHSKTDYPLLGAHQSVPCAACHLAPGVATQNAQGELVPRYKPLAHADCVSCHRDPHAGRFTGACSSCHQVESFHTLKASSGFDHERTRFPLRGAHAAVPCASCHGPKFERKTPAFAACSSCHRDAHAGLATIGGKPADCAACHDEQSFSTSTFLLAQHQLSAYPLEGRHAGVACKSCHPARGADQAARLGTARIEMRPVHALCTDCHFDPHAGRFRPHGARPRDKDCLACHTMTAFHPSAFDVAAHAKSGFPLEGAHRAVPCQACHKELNAPPAPTTLLVSAHPPAKARALLFQDAASTCAGCHQDPHGGQFAARPKGGACESCHGMDAFTPASRFDHDRDTSFPLAGAHAKAACADCHRPSRGPDGVMRVQYGSLSGRCESCHTGGAPSAPSAPKSGSSHAS